MTGHGSILEILYLDAEICGLVCPRPLYIEVADGDELFDVAYAGVEYKKVRTVYEKLGCLENLRYNEFIRGHELDRNEGGIDFLYNNIVKSILAVSVPKNINNFYKI